MQVAVIQNNVLQISQIGVKKRKRENDHRVARLRSDSLSSPVRSWPLLSSSILLYYNNHPAC